LIIIHSDQRSERISFYRSFRSLIWEFLAKFDTFRSAIW